MMVFLVLGIIQLGMMHQARLMNEYAAYRAARAGIVNHGDCDIMENAAFSAVLPTLGPPPSGGSGRVDTLGKAMVLYKAYTTIPGNKMYTGAALPLLRLEVVNPRKSQLSSLFSTYGSHMDGREIDYDDVRNDEVIAANLLSVRVTYFYNLRIPFANWMMHSFFMGRESLGDLSGVQFEVQKAGGMAATRYLEDRGAAKGGDYIQLRTLATQGTFVIPLISTYSMRMQSNLFNNGSRGPGKCAVDS
ncbi:pilus assembly protein [Hyalangium gracile]|uniref:pilus assembly protein n=1 Tax=Hyalangium gracile TaxID=394092 RepID=UPI0038994C73